jgi:hypothetical protein
MPRAASETSLYVPVKKYLQGLGFEVKGEICGCDVVALRAGTPPFVVICELKLGFNLELILQVVDRSAACDELWLAVPASTRGRLSDPRVKKLCRLLGFGLIGVSAIGQVDVLVEPKPWQPRRNMRKRSLLVREHERRRGDPALGGSAKSPIMTAYRQQALACAFSLAAGPRSTRDLRTITPEAPKILLHNVYGWFSRVERGVYDLTEAGREALARWPQSPAM